MNMCLSNNSETFIVKLYETCCFKGSAIENVLLNVKRSFVNFKKIRKYKTLYVVYIFSLKTTIGF